MHLASPCGSRSRSEVCTFHVILKVMYPPKPVSCNPLVTSPVTGSEGRRLESWCLRCDPEDHIETSPRIETSSLRPSGYLPRRCGSRTRIREHAPSVKSPFSTCQPQKPRPNSIGPMGPVKVTGQRSLFNHSVMHDIKLEYDRGPINFFLE